MNAKVSEKNMNMGGMDQFNSQFKEIHYHNHIKKVLFPVFVAILCVFFVVLTAWVFVGTLNKIKEGETIGKISENKISVSGTGEVYAKPDLAVINVSVITENSTVDEAVSENTNKMNAVINSIKAQAVEEKDLKTTTYSITPRYEYQKEETAIDNGISSTGKRVLAGYEVSQELEVKIRDLSKAGAITEAATSAGANEIGNLYFTIEDKDQFENQAKEQAIKEAKEKANNLASQLGIRLGKIVNFYENNYYDSIKNSSYTGLGEAMSSVSPSVADIQTGENKITSNITIVYEIE